LSLRDLTHTAWVKSR